MVTILIVDDRAINREFLASLLGLVGYKVIEAADGARGLDEARHHRPNLVIADVIMPVMNGVEFVRRLRADPLTAATPVIFYTATFRLGEASNLAEECHAAMVLAKPSEPQIILDAVARVLGIDAPRPQPKIGEVEPMPPGLLATDPPQGLVGLQRHLMQARADSPPNRRDVQALGMRLATLLELSLSLNGERDPENLLRFACRGAQEIMSTQHVAVGITDPDGRLQYLETIGLDPAASALIGTFRSDATSLAAYHPPGANTLSVEIASANHRYGWLYLAGAIDGTAFAENDEQIASTLAAQVAMAWENLALYEELRQSQQAVLHREERLSAMIESAMDAIVTVDHQQRIVIFNAAAEQMFGYRREEILGQRLDRLIPENVREKHRTDIERFGQFGVTARMMGGMGAISGLRANGGEFPIEASISRVGDGRRRLFTVILRDITERKRASDAMRQSEESLRATFEQAAVGIVHIDRNGHLLRANQKFCEMVGYSDEDVRRRSFVEFVHPADRDVGADALQQSVSGRIRTFTVEKRCRRSDDELIWIRITASAVHDQESGEFRYHVLIIEDITERKRVEHGLSEARTKLSLAASIAMLGFWERDLRTNEVYFSPEWKKQLGYEDGELPNRFEEWTRRLHPEDRDRVLGVQARLIEEQGGQDGNVEFEQEFRLRHKDGSYRWIASRVTSIVDEKRRPMRLMGTHLDITNRKEIEERVRQVSQHDPLTGLPNRALLYEFAEHLLSSARRGAAGTAFLFLDLDRFKPINDTYGHNIGDAVLKEIASRLTNCVRGEDLVGRFGGDEFLAVLSHVHSDADAARIARHALSCLGQPYRIAGLELAISSSIGISIFPADGESVEELIRNADTAMYHAKESGRNNFQFFKQELNERTSQALRIESRLRKGFEQREFVLYYQPVMDTENERVVSAEALLRWPAMDAGPDQFIPIAETAGFMQVLGEWVVREACAQQREWRRKGLPPISVAVNVSPTQFRQKNFARTVHDALEHAGLDPTCIRVEVTESTVMKNVSEAAGVLHALREMGVAVALDDFGTGYSSLSSLSQLPIDILKLDQSFVTKLDWDRASIAITEGMIALGQSLGLEVIAEGVESEQVLAFLRSRHCRRGQGYHFSRPLSAMEFEQWHRRRATWN